MLEQDGGDEEEVYHLQELQMGLQSFDNSSLDNTNRKLRDLERKLSLSSSSSSQQTQTSSVVHNTDLFGLGKQNIQSHVLNHLLDKKVEDKQERIHNSIFNPNELFQERSQQFMTTFGSTYNDDRMKMRSKAKTQDVKSASKLARKDSINLLQNKLEKNSFNTDDDGYRSISQNSQEEKEESPEEEEDFVDTTLEIGDDDSDFENDNHNCSCIHDDSDDEFNTADGPYMDEGLLSSSSLPPSPPRSPPQDLDPSKLYGLYNFSGPEPSHCTLSRDEPVHLVNDEDNYWWLIRKLTKIERMERLRNLGAEIPGDQEIDSDDEDGKIGFVPAECLETHGERLARLNCRKNEEMEKIAEIDIRVRKITIRSNSNVKSVKFENVGDLTESEEEEQAKEEEEEVVVEKDGVYGADLATSVYGTGIRQNLMSFNVDSPDIRPAVEEPETLSDVFPTGAPLIIKKNVRSDLKDKNSKPLSSLSQEDHHSTGLPKLVVVPPRSELRAKDYQTLKKLRDLHKKRRSRVLDSLTDITDDLQAQLNLESAEDERKGSDGDEQWEEGDSSFDISRESCNDGEVESALEAVVGLEPEEEDKQQEMEIEEKKQMEKEVDKVQEEDYDTDDDFGFSFASYQSDEIIAFVPDVKVRPVTSSSEAEEEEDDSVQEIDKKSFELAVKCEDSSRTTKAAKRMKKTRSEGETETSHNRVAIPYEDTPPRGEMVTPVKTSRDVQFDQQTNTSSASSLNFRNSPSLRSQTGEFERLSPILSSQSHPCVGGQSPSPSCVVKSEFIESRNSSLRGGCESSPCPGDKVRPKESLRIPMSSPILQQKTPPTTSSTESLNGTSLSPTFRMGKSQQTGLKVANSSSNFAGFENNNDKRGVSSPQSSTSSINNIPHNGSFKSPLSRSSTLSPMFRNSPVSQPYRGPYQLHYQQQSYGSFRGKSSLDFNDDDDDDDDDEDDDDMVSDTESNRHSLDDNITPLTSMNSLTTLEDRRKTKSVHELFMPILGKFDELAEKLAELDDILK
ncbi:uncharacterized protein LODBEIA_P04790 [Lodderomyces beijingensis]|uniref:SH3 domain-containing protein n=1 Tax=Lodderomyces beijingensis TaxID=1775926 RepID=A0ABP0ZIU3_9ASCO